MCGPGALQGGALGRGRAREGGRRTGEGACGMVCGLCFVSSRQSLLSGMAWSGMGGALAGRR
eukprot:11680497-Prorocentrum_lima.AAC.1